MVVTAKTTNLQSKNNPLDVHGYKCIAPGCNRKSKHIFGQAWLCEFHHWDAPKWQPKRFAGVLTHAK